MKRCFGGPSVKTLQALLTASVLTLSAPAQASLIGDTISCNYGGVLLACDKPTAVVDPIVTEFILNFSLIPFLFGVDIRESSITISKINPQIPTFAFGTFFDVLTLGSLDDPAGNIVGIANFATTGTVGVDESHVSFTAHSVDFQFGLTSWENGSSASFDLIVAPTGVPEPTALLLLAIGLAGLAWARKICVDKEKAQADSPPRTRPTLPIS